ncbi:MAG: hypothetical protein AABY55_04180 [Candidatus Omnitrophota bacterium]
MKKLNQGGAILGLVLVFIFIFTLMGYGLLNLGSVNAVEIVRALQSKQAFWLAEAGITKAIANLPNTGTFSENISNGSYSVTSAQIAGYTNRWDITSTGIVNLATKRIRVIIFPPVGAAIISNGPIETDLGNPTINGPVEEYAIFTFFGTFGKTEAEVYAMATHVYTDPPNNPGTETPIPVYPIDGITWIDMSPGNTLGLTSTSWSGSGLLVVNGNVSIKGGIFTGILWVNGNLTVSGGNAQVNGSIYVNGDTEVETKVTGTPIINYDTEAIDDVYVDLGYDGTGNGNGYPLAVLSWRELN